MITSCASRKSFHRSRLSLGLAGRTRARTSSRPLRFEKKVTVNGAITLHHHYLYRGYLQIVALDKKRANLQDLWLLHWDPSEAVATRPLSIRINATWFTYGYDLTKNVQEIFNTSGGIATSYDYTPFGAVSVEGTLKQPIQWSSEAYDTELALTYYNYRHYNPMDGRWINRDPINEQGGANLYGFVGNDSAGKIDYLGLLAIMECVRYANGSMSCFIVIFDKKICECKKCKVDDLSKTTSKDQFIKKAKEILECLKKHNIDKINLEFIGPIYTNYDKMEGRGPIPPELYRLLPKNTGGQCDGEQNFHKGTPSPTGLNKKAPGEVDQRGVGLRKGIRIHGVGGSRGCITTCGSTINDDGTLTPMISKIQGEGLIEKIMQDNLKCGGTYLDIIEDKNTPCPDEINSINLGGDMYAPETSQRSYLDIEL